MSGLRSLNRRLPAAALVVMAAVVGCSSGSTTIVAVSAPPNSLTASAAATPTPTPSPSLSVSPSPSATPTVHTTPAPTAHATKKRTTAPARFRFPVPVSVGNAAQIITVHAHGSYATVIGWQLSRGAWHEVIATTAARVGARGVVAGPSRVQGSNTTPGGTYTLTQAFGIKANPGAHLPYHQVTSDDWWVEDNNSAYYNQPRTGTQGGFVKTESGVNGSERLVLHTVPYQYAAVIDFNRWPAVHYRGAGIFLHVNGAGSTAGCVSVPLATMVAILRWLSPGAHPRIAIA